MLLNRRRTLFCILVPTIAVIVCIVSVCHRASLQGNLLRRLSQQPGVWIGAGAFAEDPPPEVTLSNVAVDRDHLLLLGKLRCLQLVALKDCTFIQSQIDPYNGVNSVRRSFVSIERSSFSSAQLVRSGLLNTERLWIVGAKLELTLFDSIADEAVRELRLFNCGLPAGWSDAIAECEALELLDIQGCEVSDDDVRAFQAKRPHIVFFR